MCILVQTQSFSDAWVSLNEIIWTGGTGYRGLDTLPDTNLPLVTSQSPLNDVTDLLFGIQSVQITVKQQSTD